MVTGDVTGYGGLGFCVQDDLLYVAHILLEQIVDEETGLVSSGRMVVFDFSDPSNPRLLDSYKKTDALDAMAPHRGRPVYANGTENTFIFELVPDK